MGIAIPPFKPSDYDETNSETWISIKTEDRRKCPLRGDIIVERLAPDMLQVAFSKNVGDPLQWRRFFKVGCASPAGLSIPNSRYIYRKLPCCARRLCSQVTITELLLLFFSFNFYVDTVGECYFARELVWSSHQHL